MYPDPPDHFVPIRISPTIAGEYESRCPEDIPPEARHAGIRSVSPAIARAMLADAEFNSDKTVFDIGEDGMPLSIYNAYVALAKQIRQALTWASVE